MKWIQENPFLSGLIGATVVIGGALAFLLTQAMANYQSTNDSYIASVGQLQQLQSSKPFPNEENLKIAKEKGAEFEKEAKAFQQKLLKLEVPVDSSVTPQKFQDDLRTTVDETIRKAGEANVEVPENFYLGFDQYRTNLPSDKAAPVLARQLAVISSVVNELISSKITAVNDLKRTPLPEEGGQGQQGGGGQNNAQASKSVLSRYPFELSFTADQSKFRGVFNALLENKQFLVIRALSVQNTQLAGPPKNAGGSDDAQASPSSSQGASGQDEAAKDLNVILGREQVVVSARIELIDFTEPVAAK